MARLHYVGVVQGRVGESSVAGVVMGLPDTSADTPFLHAAQMGDHVAMGMFGFGWG